MDAHFERESVDSGQVRDCANIVRVTSMALLLSLILSWRAYIPNLRIFEMSPVIELLGAIPIWADWALLILNIGCVGWLLIKPLQPLPAFGLFACTVFWVSQDLLRFQPYTYMYVFTILLAVFFTSHAINALKIMVGSVYMWAGVHKLNATFFLDLFPGLIEPFYTFPKEPSLLAALIALAIFTVPLFEAGIGLLLLFFPRQRQLTILMAFIMLVVVLVCLGFDSHTWNLIVWPWNIYLFLLVCILLSKSSAVDNKVRFGFDTARLATIALFSIVPALALFGWGHSYPSFKLYSGNTKRAEVMFSEHETLTGLPNNLGQLVGRARRLPLVDWTAHEFELVVYPETYVFRRGAKGLCPYLSDGQQAILRIYDQPAFNRIDQTYEDFPLCGTESN